MTPEDRAKEVISGPGPLSDEYRGKIAQAIREAERNAILSEREACAKHLEAAAAECEAAIAHCSPFDEVSVETAEGWAVQSLLDGAAAIRARADV